jgi:hypothetical protein
MFTAIYQSAVERNLLHALTMPWKDGPILLDSSAFLSCRLAKSLHAENRPLKSPEALALLVPQQT